MPRSAKTMPLGLAHTAIWNAIQNQDKASASSVLINYDCSPDVSPRVPSSFISLGPLIGKLRLDLWRPRSREWPAALRKPRLPRKQGAGKGLKVAAVVAVALPLLVSWLVTRGYGSESAGWRRAHRPVFQVHTEKHVSVMFDAQLLE